MLDPSFFVRRTARESAQQSRAGTTPERGLQLERKIGRWPAGDVETRRVGTKVEGKPTVLSTRTQLPLYCIRTLDFYNHTVSHLCSVA